MKMIEITQEEFESDMDSYMDRIEEGELFLIRLPDGRAVAADTVAFTGGDYFGAGQDYINFGGDTTISSGSDTISFT